MTTKEARNKMLEWASENLIHGDEYNSVIDDSMSEADMGKLVSATEWLRGEVRRRLKPRRARERTSR